MAQVCRLHGVPVVDVIVVASAQHVAAAQRQRARRKATAVRRAVLADLLVRANVEETGRLVLASGGEGIATWMELIWGKVISLLQSRLE